MKVSLAISTIRVLAAIPLILEGGVLTVIGIIMFAIYAFFFCLRLKYFIESA